MPKIISMSSSPIYPVISLFSGAMGLDLGLESAGLNIAISQDIDKWCIQTIIHNGRKALAGDIRELIKKNSSCEFLTSAASIREQDIFAIVGGPPCQAFSTAGKRQGTNDSRGMLFNQFIHVVNKLQPRFFVMENVKGLASMPSNPDEKSSPPLLVQILIKFREAGYHTVHGVLDAVHYGAPQFRERLIIVGSRDNEPIFLPAPTHFHLHQHPSLRWKTLFDAIGDIDGGNDLCAKFSTNIAKYLTYVPEGGNWRSLSPIMAKNAMGGAYHSGGGKVGFYRRLAFNAPSPTLVTSPTQKATILCHPRENRPLSIREYARIQGFPDSWEFKGSLMECYKQIGNAVPANLGHAIGQMLLSVSYGDSEVKVKRMRGTSVHSEMQKLSLTLSGKRAVK